MGHAVCYSRGPEAGIVAGLSCKKPRLAKCKQIFLHAAEGGVISLGKQPPSQVDGNKICCLVTGEDNVYESNRKRSCEKTLLKDLCVLPPLAAGQAAISLPHM